MTDTNAPDSVAASAHPSSAGGQFDAKNTTAPTRRLRWWRPLAWGLGGLVATLLLALAGAWMWAGSEGSLATALRWAGALQPLVTDEVTGNLRSAGKVRRLVWARGGLRVEMHDAELRWTPAALLGGTLQIDQLGASRIVVDDQRPPSAEPSAGPPASVALPLRLQVKALTAGELRWAGPPPYTLQDVAGRFDFDGTRHLLELDHARVEGGVYRARAAVTAQAPLRLDVALAGALSAPVPGASAPVPLTLQATLQGPLTDLRAQAHLQTAPRADPAAAPQAPALPPPGQPAAPAASAPSAAGAPEAHASARITPWAAQPLPEAHARVQALDLGALWAQAPRTQLDGQFDLAPLPAGGPTGWAVQADLANATPGPWDQRRLPLHRLQAHLNWADGVADVRTLVAHLAGGRIESTGRWAGSAGAPAPGRWRIDTRIEGVNPAGLHSQLAAFPVDGSAQVSGAGTAIDFDAALQARPQRAAAARAGESAAQALARDLQALRLRELRATGRWDQGLLALRQLRVRTDEAELSGQAQLRPAAPGGSADLALTVPGATLALKGDAQPDRGAGTLRANVANATRLLAWARKLPGASPVLQGVQASGHASLQGSWQGGWRDPALQIQLAAPQLDVQPPDAGQALVQLRGLSATLSGRLAQAQLAVDGRVSQGARQLDLRLAANGGRTTPAAPLAQSGWRLVLARLQAGVRDPALGPGSWQLATRAPVQLQWSPQQGGQFEAGAGELTVASPPPVAQAVVAWGPARWRAGDLRSTGRLTGLPLEWAERLAGTRLADAGLTGSVVFNGDWDVALGRELRLHAQLARASGDLTVLATDAQTGVQSRVAAGLREARLTLSSTGTALNLALRWDSTHAGTIDGTLRTELAAHADGGGTQWSWPGQAPLQGQVQARLPQLSAWSVLAPPGWRLRGALQADARITGTRAAPQWSGTLAADDLALRSVVDGLQFGGGRLRARLDGTRLLVDEFLLRGAGAQGSGGTLRASGEAGWAQGRAQARLSATLDKLRASIRADRQLTVSGHLTAALDGRQIQTDGRLRVDRARIELPDDSAPRLGSDVVVRGPDGRAATGKTAPGTVALPTSSAGQRGAETPASSQTSPLTAKAEVQIDLGDDFRLHGMGIDTRLAGVLTLSAHGPITAMPRIHGTVHTVDGTVQAYSQQLNIRRGQIAFTGDAANPTLDIIALRPNYASDQQVGAQVQGTALLPRVRLYSQPALPDNETLAWLLLGRAAPSSGAEAAMLQSAALALLGGREGRGLASRLGLDELSFSGGTSGGLADASVTLGKRLSDRLYAAYEHSLAGASGTLLIFYELSRRWTVRGQAGENAAVDLIYRLSFD